MSFNILLAAMISVCVWAAECSLKAHVEVDNNEEDVRMQPDLSDRAIHLGKKQDQKVY